VKSAQQSVHLTGGILRHFRAFSTPEQNPALEVLSTPAHPQVTLAVGRHLKDDAKTFLLLSGIFLKTWNPLQQ
jgi:hypothetical protein